MQSWSITRELLDIMRDVRHSEPKENKFNWSVSAMPAESPHPRNPRQNPAATADTLLNVDMNFAFLSELVVKKAQNIKKSTCDAPSACPCHAPCLVTTLFRKNASEHT